MADDERLRPNRVPASLIPWVVVGAVALMSCSSGVDARSTSTSAQSTEQAPPTSEALSSPATSVAPVVAAQFHCGDETECPRLVIEGDPVGAFDDHFFRGYGDPSLAFDAATGDLWLAYSLLDTQASDLGGRDRQVRTHLARSTDAGITFQFVRAINDVEQMNHPVSSEAGWTHHEVSTLVKGSSGEWQMVFLTYFDRLGETPADHSDSTTSERVRIRRASLAM